jgi:hypothetical protein
VLVGRGVADWIGLDKLGGAGEEGAREGRDTGAGGRLDV